MKLFIRTTLILAFAAAAMATTACNTTKGIGKDLESAGSGIKESAERSGAQ